MSPIQIYVATRDGQSTRIAQHIAIRLSENGIPAGLHLLPSADMISRAYSDMSLIVLVAAVRYGRHLPEAEAFLYQYSRLSNRPPLALASVNLTARKPNRQSALENGYLRKIIVRFKLTPILAYAIAGRLEYPRYRWFDRQVIRLIMAITGGPTDGTSSIEFTRWEQVDKFASEIAEYVAARLLSRAALRQ